MNTEDTVVKHVDLATIAEIRRKYLQLGREIAQSGGKGTDMQAIHARASMEHTHSKLGIQLEELIGTKLWRQE